MIQSIGLDPLIHDDYIASVMNLDYTKASTVMKFDYISNTQLNVASPHASTSKEQPIVHIFNSSLIAVRFDVALFCLLRLCVCAIQTVLGERKNH